MPTSATAREAWYAAALACFAVTLSGDGGGNDDNFQLQGGLVLEQKGRLKSKLSVTGCEAVVHQGRQQLVGTAGFPA